MKTDDIMAVDIVEEGDCYGNYSNRAKACKECLVWEECKEETKKIKKEAKK